MRELYRFAALQGIRIHATHMPSGLLGEWDERTKEIWFDLGLTPAEQASVIAHELGHWYFGHSCQSGPNERQADHFAASLLIDPNEYQRLAQINDDIEYLADEFGVTEEVIADYRRHCLRKIGSLVYGKRIHDRERRLA